MRSLRVGGAPLPLTAALAVIASLICLRTGLAQITPGTTLNAFTATPTNVAGSRGVYTITGGMQRGNNLFHSFADFNVPTSGQANFYGPASTANVLTRVTGGSPSTIDGVIS